MPSLCVNMPLPVLDLSNSLTAERASSKRVLYIARFEMIPSNPEVSGIFNQGKWIDIDMFYKVCQVVLYKTNVKAFLGRQNR